MGTLAKKFADKTLYGRIFEKDSIRTVTHTEYGSVGTYSVKGQNLLWMEARPAEGTNGQFALFIRQRALCPGVDSGGLQDSETRVRDLNKSIYTKDEVVFLVNAREELWKSEGFVQSIEQPFKNALVEKMPANVMGMIIALEKKNREREKNSPVKIYKPA